MSEFNPSERDLLNLEDKITSLLNKKSELALLKMKIQDRTTEIKNELKESQSSIHSMSLKKERDFLLKKGSILVEEMTKINIEQRFKSQLRDEVKLFLKNKTIDSIDALTIDESLIKELKFLRNKYSEFTKDKTRVSSMRIMAAEFRDELSKIINNIKII